MDDIIKSIKATLYERVSSPLWSILSIAFVVINYDILIIIFSDMKPTDKIACVTIEFAGWTRTIKTVLYSLALLIIWPPVSTLAYWWWSFGGQWTRIIKFRREGKIPISFSESIDLRRKIKEAEESIKNTIAESTALLNNERSKVTVLEGVNSELNDKLLRLQEMNNALIAKAQNGNIEYNEIKNNSVYSDIIKTFTKLSTGAAIISLNAKAIKERGVDCEVHRIELGLIKLKELGYLDTSNGVEFVIGIKGRKYIEWLEQNG